MKVAQLKGQFCQSCGMPAEKAEDYGTNTDGSKSKDYCHFCFTKGKFTDPDITLEQMIDKVVEYAKQLKVPADKAKEMVKDFIPQLKRWQGR